MGSRGNNKSNSNLISLIDNLPQSSSSLNVDSKKTPLLYDKSAFDAIMFGNWREDGKDLGIQEVDINSIRTIQPSIMTNNLKQMINNDVDISTDNISLLQYNNKLFVYDGNHRIVLNKLKGKKKVKVRVIKID